MNAAPAAAAKLSYKEQMLRSREEAIISTANRLLAEKGFDAMSVDEVAAAVGIAKASLFQHFPSKEDLATAAMVRVLRRALEFVEQLPQQQAPLAKLRAVAAWAIQLQLDGDMPLVPSQNSSLRNTLMTSADFTAVLEDVSDRLLAWIGGAQADGTLTTTLPSQVVLYTLYARACDPVVEYLNEQGEYTAAEIVDFVLGACFDGLKAR